MLKLKKKVNFYKSLFSKENYGGQEVLADLANKCRIYKPLYSEHGGIDPNMLTFREGQRSVFLYIKSRLDIDDEQLEEMIKNGTRNLEQ